MLGSAPGTDRLNMWVEGLDEGYTLADIAEHIAASDAFQALYPSFLTTEEFADAFLSNALGDSVSEAIHAAAVGIVVGLLNDGMTRGALALAAVHAMFDVAAQGEDGPAYADLGNAAMAFANQVEVAEYYTVTLRQSGPNSRVLRGVDAENGLAEVQDGISDHLDPPDPISLTSNRDNVEGTIANDLISAEPDSKGESTLGSADSIDGGAGYDTLEIYTIDDELIIDSAVDADVQNVEHVFISTRGSIDVDLTQWDGLERLELGRFGKASDVTAVVDGAEVTLGRTAGGALTIVGAGGDLSVAAGSSSAVKIGSGAHTTSVSVKGGASVDIAANTGDKQSETVTSVSLDGVKRNQGNDDANGVSMERVPNPDFDAEAEQVGQNLPYLDANGDPTDDDADNTATEAAAMQVVDGSADMPSVHIRSEAIETVSLSNNDAIVAVINGSDDPEDISVTVSGYGSHTKTAARGKLCLAGDGAAENVSIEVAGDSDFYLATDVIETLSISGDADLEISVTTFDDLMTNSGTLESLTLGGSGAVDFDGAGMGKLESVDASGSSGANTIKMLGASVESVMGGSGKDTVSMMGALASGGLAADLGDGDDTYSAGAGNDDSRIEGGAGNDTLKLTSGDGATYTSAGKSFSIYTGFEVLDVAGGSGDYDVGKLGVGSVSVSGNTAAGATVNLMEVAAGTGLSVSGVRARGNTAAAVSYTLAEAEQGSLIGGGNSSILNISLLAIGFKDTKTLLKGSHQADLTLTVDNNIRGLIIDTNALPNAADGAGRDAPGAGDYSNRVSIVENDAVEEVKVTGNAKATLAPTDTAGGLDSLRFVDATENTGGVTVVAGDANSAEIRMLGGSAGDNFTTGTGDSTLMGNGGTDMLTGGSGADTLRGGAGGDTLTGGAGDDEFEYTATSDSQLAYTATGVAYGFDTIVDWDEGTNEITLGRTLYNSLDGAIKNAAGVEINSTDDDATLGDAATLNSLRAFLGNGENIFKTITPNTGDSVGSTTTTHPIVLVNESYEVAVDSNNDGMIDDQDTPDGRTRTWVLIDVDGDGDFDAATDMVIALTGTHTLNGEDFGA